MPAPAKAGKPSVPADSIRYVEPPTASELENLLKQAGKKKMKTGELDAFWGEAAAKHGTASTNPDVISYEKALQLGLVIPGDEK